MKYLLLILFVVTSSNAQSLLANASFDADISSWDTQFVNAQWIANDGASSSGNGSLQFGVNSGGGGWVTIRSELVPVVPNYHYILGSSIKKPNASLSEAAYVSIKWYDVNDNFLGDYPTYISKPFIIMSTPDVWIDDISEWDNIVENAVKARVELWVNVPQGTGGDSHLRFDDIIFFQDTVFKSAFE